MPKTKMSSLTKGDRILEKYLEEIGKEPLITSEKEIELAKRIKKGDQQALEELTRANLRFVVSVAKHYQNQGVPLKDLVNEGNIGLIKAAKRFDERKGFKFISYAVWWIRQSILQALAEQSRMVRLPLNKINTLQKIKKTSKSLEQENERLPTFGEIAEEIQLSEEEVNDTVKKSMRHLSLDAPFNDDEEHSLLNVIEHEEAPQTDELLMKDALKKEIEKTLSSLKKREAEVIRLYFGINQEKAYTLEEIGKMLGLTRERIRQIKKKAIFRLRHVSRSRNLKPFMD
jgi:RNA polymerase primary sigma factor